MKRLMSMILALVVSFSMAGGIVAISANAEQKSETLTGTVYELDEKGIREKDIENLVWEVMNLQ